MIWRYALNLLMILAITSPIYTLEPIKLESPEMNSGKKFMHAVINRHSTRQWGNKKLSKKLLSNLIWTAWGINRPENLCIPLKGTHTAPSFCNVQDVDLYLLMEKGVYLYNPVENILNPLVQGDYRYLAVGFQQGMGIEFAPFIVILVSDTSKFSKFGPLSAYDKLQYAGVDAGLISQNINLFCAAFGLNTVPRANMDYNELRRILNLRDEQIPILNNVVGYPIEGVDRTKKVNTINEDFKDTSTDDDDQ